MLRSGLSPRVNVERESCRPAVEVDSILMFVADWTRGGCRLHEGTVLLRQNHVLFGVLKNDLGTRDQCGRKERIRVAALPVWQISVSTVRHEHTFHIACHNLVVVHLDTHVGGLRISEKTDVGTHVSGSSRVEMRDHGCAGRGRRREKCCGHEGGCRGVSLLMGVANGRRHGVVGGRVGRGFIFSRNGNSGGVLNDVDVERARFGHQGAILHEVVFSSAGVAYTTVALAVASAAATTGGFALRALLVTARGLGMVVPLDALVLEAPLAVVCLEGDGVGFFFAGEVAALLIAAHVVFEGRDHRLVLHLRVEVTSLCTSLFTFGFEPPPADLEAPTAVVTAFLLDGVASVLESVDPGTLFDAEGGLCCLQ